MLSPSLQHTDLTEEAGTRRLSRCSKRRQARYAPERWHRGSSGRRPSWAADARKLHQGLRNSHQTYTDTIRRDGSGCKVTNTWCRSSAILLYSCCCTLSKTQTEESIKGLGEYGCGLRRTAQRRTSCRQTSVDRSTAVEGFSGESEAEALTVRHSKTSVSLCGAPHAHRKMLMVRLEKRWGFTLLAMLAISVSPADEVTLCSFHIRSVSYIMTIVSHESGPLEGLRSHAVASCRQQVNPSDR